MVNEFFGYIKGRKFLDYLSNYKLLKKDSDLWRWLVVSLAF